MNAALRVLKLITDPNINHVSVKFVEEYSEVLDGNKAARMHEDNEIQALILQYDDNLIIEIKELS